MAESTYNQRYASADSSTAGAFAFDTISAKDYAVSKLAFGAVGAVTYVSASDPLPVTIDGVATAANQTTANGLLTTIDADTGGIATSAASIDTKTPALGQALAAASVPVVLTAAQVSALTPPAAITGFATAANQATLIGHVDGVEGLLTAIAAAQLPDSHNVTVDNASLPVTGTFWQATQPISGTVAATQSGTWNVTNVSGTVSLPTGASTLTEQQSQTTHLATIAGDTTAIETAVQLIDDTVVAVDAAGTTAKVLMQGAIRDDALSALTPAEGDAVNLRTDANGALWVIPSGTSTVSGTVAATQSGTWTVQPGNTANTTAWLVTGTGGTFPVTGTFWQATQPVSLASVPSHAVTNAGTFAVQVDGAALTSLQLIDDAIATTASAIPTKGVAISGTDGTNARVVSVDATGHLQIDALSITPGTAAANLGKAEDAAHASGDTGVMALAVRKATPANVSGTDGDYEPLQISAGRLWASATIDAALPAGTNAIGKLAANSGVTIGAVEIAAAQTLATVTTLTGGGVAHDAADSGNPVKVGGKACAALSTATMVADADRANLVTDIDGALLIRQGAPLGDNVSACQSVTDTTSTAATGFSAAAGTKNVITEITIFNSSATATFVKLQDGSGGTMFWACPAPAGSGSVIQFARGLKQPTANTALYFAANASASTIYISINGYKSKV